MSILISARLLRGKSHLTALFCSALEPVLAVDFERFAFCDRPLATLIWDTIVSAYLEGIKGKNILEA